MTNFAAFLVLLALVVALVRPLGRVARRPGSAAPLGADLSRDHDLDRLRGELDAAVLSRQAWPAAPAARPAPRSTRPHGAGRHLPHAA